MVQNIAHMQMISYKTFQFDNIANIKPKQEDKCEEQTKRVLTFVYKKRLNSFHFSLIYICRKKFPSHKFAKHYNLLNGFCFSEPIDCLKSIHRFIIVIITDTKCES